MPLTTTEKNLYRKAKNVKHSTSLYGGDTHRLSPCLQFGFSHSKKHNRVVVGADMQECAGALMSFSICMHTARESSGDVTRTREVEDDTQIDIICKVLWVQCERRGGGGSTFIKACIFIIIRHERHFNHNGIPNNSLSNKLLSLFDMLLLFLPPLFASHTKRANKSKNRFSQSTKQNESEAF